MRIVCVCVCVCVCLCVYDMCDSFLRPVIISRKTSSNYMKTVPKLKSNEVTYSPMQFKVVVPENVKSSVAYRDNIVAKTSSAKGIPADFCASSSSNDTSESVMSESAEMIFHSLKQLQEQVQPQQSQSPSTLEIGPPREEVNTAQQILQTMTKTAAKIVPSPDSFNKRKKKPDDDLTQVYVK